MIKRPIFAIVMATIIVILGLISLSKLPIEQYPNITPPVVEVSATYPGADASVVSQSVATPIAQSIMGVEDMLYMQATSANDGTLSLAVTFDIGSNPDMNTVFTQNRVSGIISSLPSEVKEQGVTVQKTSNSFILVISLFSDGRYDQKFLSNYAIINLKNELLKINGVGKVNVMGAGEYSMRVWLKPEMLEYYNVNVQQIISKIEAQSGVFPVGKLGADPSSTPSQFTYTVMLPPSISTPEQYEDIVLNTTPDGAMVRLKDVARVEFGTQTYGVTSTYNASPAAMIAIYQAPGSNALEVGNQIKSTMDQLKDKFPTGIEYKTVVDTTLVISEGAKEIVYTLLIALLLVVMIIYLFVQDFRAMIIPVVAIPVSLIGVFALFPLLGFSINVFSLLGLVLAIGLVVDDAIVVVEAVQVQLEKGLSPRDATVQAMKLVKSPIIATTLVLSAVFIPVSLMGGITGLLYQQFAITIVFSVLISAVNALTLSPALCSIWLRRKEKPTHGFFFKFNNMFARSVNRYENFATRITRHAARTLLFIAIVGGAVAYLFKSMPTGLLPEEDQGYIMTAITLPDAASLNRTTEVANFASEIISKRKDVVSTTTISGFNMLSGVASTNSAIIFTTLTNSSKREKAATIANELNGELYVAIQAGECYTFGPPPIPAIGTSSGFTMMLQSNTNPSPKYLEKQIDLFLEAANKRPEIGKAYSEYSASIPSKGITIDKDALMTEGVELDDLYQTLSAFMGGSYVNNFNRFGKLYQTYIQADGDYRRTESDLNNYFVMNNEGRSVPISAFVTLHDTTTTQYITDFNLLNSATIMGNAASGYSPSEAMDALSEVAAQVLPADMSYSWSGMSYQEQKASSGEMISYLAAIVFVFLVLSALYESWYLPFSILLGIPFALFGALIFSYLAHMLEPTYTDNIFLQISLIMLIGLSAKNAILIIEYAEKIYIGGATLTQAAIGAARLRIRPIIMTALAFIIGVMPLIFATGSNAIARNVMGVALVGGMLIATIIGLFVYPALYVVIGKVGNFEKRRQKMKEEIE